MVLDIGVMLSIATILGGLITWGVSEVRNKSKNKLDLERRISLIEASMSLNTTGDNVLKDSLTETKSSLKELEERVRKVEIDIAVMK